MRLARTPYRAGRSDYSFMSECNFCSRADGYVNVGLNYGYSGHEHRSESSKCCTALFKVSC